MLNNLCRLEEDKLPQDNFSGTISKGCKYSLLICVVIMLGMGILSLGNEVSVFFFAVALLISALLPTYFSYRCYIDKEVLKISYFILCYKVKKETLWKDVAYKTVKRDSDGNPQSIRLLDANKKTLASFDAVIVGFERIVKIAEHVPKLKK